MSPARLVAFVFASSCVFGVVCFACGDLKLAPENPDAGASDSTSTSSTSSSSSSGSSSTSSGGSSGMTTSSSSSGGAGDSGPIPKGDSGVGPVAPCRPVPAECLDPAPANVIDVPAEMAFPNALTAAKPGDTVQVRNLTIPQGYQIPNGVTLRGCEGAIISHQIAFKGATGTIEGFVIPGSIIVNRAGTFVIRRNQFGAGGSVNDFGVSARFVDGIVTGSMDVRVDANRFDTRDRGIEVLTSYDTGPRNIDIVVRNNVFRHVKRPLYVGETGIVGVIKAVAEHNTFFNFETAIQLVSTSTETKTRGNIFMSGDRCVDGTPYSVEHSYKSLVSDIGSQAPLSGTIEHGPSGFLDFANGDLRLGPSSQMVDQIPAGTTVPAEDYQGCPRPAGASGKADIGAYESQP